MTALNDHLDVNIIFVVILSSIILALFLCVYIIALVAFTKSLHTLANLLVCNTCFGTILYSITITVKICFFYTQFVFSDSICQTLAYLNTACLSMIIYSYNIQALSRLFFTILYRHRSLLSYKTHAILIVGQLGLSFLIPLPTFLSRIVQFRVMHMCYIDMTDILHVSYFFVSTYFFPFVVTVGIYACIYYRVVQSSKAARQSSHSHQRDLLLMRNIFILFMILVLAGAPGIGYSIAHSNTKPLPNNFYFVLVLCTTLAAVIKTMCIIVLNSEIRKKTKKLCRKLPLIGALAGKQSPPVTFINPASHRSLN